jgi:hypothetical protein
MPPCRSHGSTHSRWNWCRHGSVRIISPGSAWEMQMEHVSPPLSSSVAHLGAAASALQSSAGSAAPSGRTATALAPGVASASCGQLQAADAAPAAGAAAPAAAPLGARGS